MSQIHSLRIAVEGCGHGTLDAIYASVEKGREVKGWDEVDLVIICGDFQAVRNHQDLNVTAMPAKYRKMGDFHHYYYGTKTAPYLTVFIGGNHEASNHLFELHYGGWAAPNIYYLGAANVVKLGPLTIAATSGVYKRYDYRKPHFERLPYNGSEIRSIYHQRELDIRKLLSYRSQVDVGLSHDWPKGIEWMGDHKQLFARKKYLRAEAEAGELGSVPSALVLDRLRPPYWFAAHHHYRYPAWKIHKNIKDEPKTEAAEVNTAVDAKSADQEVDRDEELGKPNSQRGSGVTSTILTERAAKRSPGPPAETPTLGSGISAWNTFKNHIRDEDAEAEARDEQARRLQVEEQERTGRQAFAGYQFEENFREVSIVQGKGAQDRKSQSPKKPVAQQIPQLDGVCCSSLTKRRRDSSPSDDTQPSLRSRLGGQVNGSAPETTVTNPDAIDIDMSDVDSNSDQSSPTRPEDRNGKMSKPAHDTGKNDADLDVKGDVDDPQPRGNSYQRSSRTLPRMPLIQEVASQESSAAADSSLAASGVDSSSTIVGNQSSESFLGTGYAVEVQPGNDHQGILASTNTMSAQSVSPEDDVASTFTRYVADASLDSTDGGVRLDQQSDSDQVSEAGEDTNGDQVTEGPDDQTTTGSRSNETDIPDDVRAQLAEMSSTFAPEEKFVKSAHLPFPPDITNKTTRFLALGKVEEGHANDFLQLIEIEHYDAFNVKEPEPTYPPQPYELQYDPEWLAITRVFAPELKLGGSSRDRIPEHRGETYFRDRILEEEEWVNENIVRKGLLTIPKNFIVQTEQQDWGALPYKEKSSMPRELTNPQTSQFCELVGIPNPFDISEEERDARMEQGPAADNYQERTNNRGRGGFRGNNRGGRGGWQGRGRGDGRGRGRGRG